MNFFFVLIGFLLQCFLFFGGGGEGTDETRVIMKTVADH